MNVHNWKAKKSPFRVPGTMINVTPEEALQLIESLASQLSHKNPNTGRAEFVTDDGEYFSVAVIIKG